MGSKLLKNKEYTEGGLDYEKHPPEWHWWVQAEAMVGFLNAYELSNEAHFLDKSVACWDFTKRFFIDHINGEWFWGYTADGQLMRGEDKVGFWKCPYHNARACMEVGRRLEKLNGLFKIICFISLIFCDLF